MRETKRIIQEFIEILRSVIREFTMLFMLIEIEIVKTAILVTRYKKPRMYPLLLHMRGLNIAQRRDKYFVSTM